SAEICPQRGHIRLVFRGGTATKYPPRQALLYSSWRRNSPQPWSKIALFRPDFARTLRPGASAQPFAEMLMLRTCKSSTAIIAWFLLIVFDALCRKSARTFAMRAWIRWTRVFAFTQFLEPLTLRAMRRWYL